MDNIGIIGFAIIAFLHLLIFTLFKELFELLEEFIFLYIIYFQFFFRNRVLNLFIFSDFLLKYES